MARLLTIRMFENWPGVLREFISRSSDVSMIAPTPALGNKGPRGAITKTKLRSKWAAKDENVSILHASVKNQFGSLQGILASLSSTM